MKKKKEEKSEMFMTPPKIVSSLYYEPKLNEPNGVVRIDFIPNKIFRCINIYLKFDFYR